MAFRVPYSLNTGSFAGAADNKDWLGVARQIDRNFKELEAGIDQTLDHGVYQDYTPVLYATVTDPTLGTTGAFHQDGSYTRIGDLVHYEFHLRFGNVGPNAGSGNYSISLPVNGWTATSTGMQSVVGNLRLRPTAAVEVTWQWHQILSGTPDRLTLLYQAAHNGAIASVTHAAPVAWVAGSLLWGSIIYRAA